MKYILIFMLFSAVGCTNPWGRVVTDGAAGAAAGWAASTATRGNPGYTALATVGGIGVAEGIRAWKIKGDEKAIRSERQARLGQETKAEYFRHQDDQRPHVSPSALLPVPLPSRVTKDGVHLEPATQWIEIHQ